MPASPKFLRPYPTSLLSGLAGLAAVFIGLIELPAQTPPASLSPPTTERAKALLLLNRLTYGPRPGDLDAVLQEGVESYLRRQVTPPVAEISHDLPVALPLLQKSRAELVADFRAFEAFRNQRRNAGEGDQSPRRPPPELREITLLLPQLQLAKLSRAINSPHQLNEILTDFWFNHFNVDARKQPTLPLLPDYESTTIRPHVWGSFREMLGAVAQHGAMLVYLDNWRSVGGRATEPRMVDIMMQEETAAPPSRRGLNENFGRELLELHTLGVDAGYTQDDVHNAARTFTGWTIEPSTGEFVFRPRAHDFSDKVILGRSLSSGGGRDDGEKLLDLLATHPATSRQISRKLLQRFVADEPPADYIQRVADVFLRTGGQLHPTYEAIFFDPAFFPTALASPKLRSPWEFAVACLRATGAEWNGPTSNASEDLAPPDREQMAVEIAAPQRPGRGPLPAILALGQIPYQCAPPTGYPEDSQHWNTAGAALSRMKFALQLMGPGLGDLQATWPSEEPDGAIGTFKSARQISQTLLGRPASTATLEVMENTLRERDPGAPRRAVALLLGSPDFQTK